VHEVDESRAGIRDVVAYDGTHVAEVPVHGCGIEVAVFLGDRELV